MSAFYKTIRVILQPIVRIMFRIRCVGKENIPANGAFMLCCNHTSMLDIPLLIALCPREINFMGKKELFKNPFIGFIFKKMGAFPVDRGGRDIASIRHSCKLIKEGRVLGIFPEGKRYREPAPIREVKPGCSFIAMKTGSDILPVSIYKTGKARPFRSVTVRFGEVMKISDLYEGKATKENLAVVSDEILGAINSLWEMKK